MLRHKRPFTLLEFFLVMAIVGALSGIIGISVTRAVFEQRFRSEVDLVVDQLRLAQDLMLIFHGDVHFLVEAREDGLYYTLSMDQRLPSNWAKEIQRSHTPLKAIHAFSFSGDVANPLDLQFLSDGAVMSKGVITLASSQRLGFGTFRRFISLPGYPAPIISVAEVKDIKYPEENTLFNEQLTARTIEELKTLGVVK